MQAMVINSPEILSYLIRSPENVSYISPDGESAFSLACFYGDKYLSAIFAMLKINGNKQIEPQISIQCKGICHWICQLANYDVAKAMLSTSGVVINRLDKKGHPGIFILDDTKKSDDEITNFLSLLIENGFNVNIRVPPVNRIFKTESILEKFTFSIKPNLTIIKFLIDYGADIYVPIKGSDIKLIDKALKIRNKKIKEIYENGE